MPFDSYLSKLKTFANSECPPPPPPPPKAPTIEKSEIPDYALNCTSKEKVTMVRLATASATTGTLRLSPFDTWCSGRPVPMVWFYPVTVDTETLVSSLALVLETGFQHLCGRYSGNRPATAIELSNVGLPLYINQSEKSFSNATEHLPGAGAASTATFYNRDAHEVMSGTLYSTARALCC